VTTDSGPRIRICSTAEEALMAYEMGALLRRRSLWSEKWVPVKDADIMDRWRVREMRAKQQSGTVWNPQDMYGYYVE